jgi:enolase
LKQQNAIYFGDEIMVALDCAAAAEFYVNGKYDYSKFEGETGKIRSLPNK